MDESMLPVKVAVTNFPPTNMGEIKGTLRTYTLIPNDVNGPTLILPHKPRRYRARLYVLTPPGGSASGEYAWLCESSSDAQQRQGALIEPGYWTEIDATSEVWGIADPTSTVNTVISVVDQIRE